MSTNIQRDSSSCDPKDVTIDLDDEKKEEIQQNGLTWALLWFILNVSLAILMKHIFTSSRFKFPVTLSAVHMFMSTFLSRLVSLESSKPTSEEGNRRLQYFVVLFCLNIAFGNISVKIVSLPLSQVVRSTTPIFTMILSIIVLKTFPSVKTAISVIPIVTGVAMTVYSDTEMDTTSLVILFIGNMFASLKTVLTNKYLTDQYKVNPMVMLAKLAPMSTIVMLVFAAIGGELTKLFSIWNEIGLVWYILVVFSGVVAFFLNWTNFLANMYTTPLTIAVLANIKQIVLVLMSSVMFNTPLNPLGNIGVVVATVGMLLYSYSKYRERETDKGKK